MNRVAEEMTGRTSEQALGRPATDLLWLIHPDGEPVEDLVRGVILEGQPVNLPVNICLQGGHGRRYAVEGSVEPRRNEGRLEGAVIVLRDVSEQRFALEVARQDNKHEALTRFADGIAGHLDEELSTVARQAAQLLGTLEPGTALRPAAESIETAAARARAVTSDLHEFARPPKMELQSVWVNQVLSTLEPAWRNVMPALTLQLDVDPRPAYANSRELTRVMETILLHARKSMQPGGSVWMETSRFLMGGLSEWVRARVSYASSRETADSVERAFDPSWEGKWEGLPLAYGLTRQMGGVLTARQEGKRMVTFEVLLPSIEATSASVPAEWGERPVILLIEPDSEIRRRLHYWFDRGGYNVLEASSCQEAVAAAELYEGHIPLAIGNPSAEDPGRAELDEALRRIRPATYLRLFDGRWQEPGNGAAEICNPLSGARLLEWVNSVLGPSRAYVSSRA
jgi:PAS domain S-box-containing protein